MILLDFVERADFFFILSIKIKWNKQNIPNWEKNIKKTNSTTQAPNMQPTVCILLMALAI